MSLPLGTDIELRVSDEPTKSIKDVDRLALKPSSYAKGAPSSKKSFELTGGLPTLDDYMRYIELLYECWHDAPPANLSIDRLTYTVQVPHDEMGIPSVGRSIVNMVRKLTFQTPKPYPLQVLLNVTSTIKGRSMTLILGPPGAGKSAMLKALAGRLPMKKSRTHSVQGDVLFNGLTIEEHKSIKQSINQLCGYVGQTDVHLANITVRETLDFALLSSVVDPALFQQGSNQSSSQSARMEELRALHARKVDIILSVIGMHECAETVVGNESLKGISGGQKRRLSVAEFMITNARALLLDEATSGLDAAVAKDLFDCLKKWCELSGGTIVTALQQPTPEVFALFDELILLREGRVMFQGRSEDVASFLWIHHGIEVNPGQDLADFLVEWLTDPVVTYSRQRRRWTKYGVPAAIAGYNVRSTVAVADPAQTVDQLTVAPETARVCITSDCMVSAYRSSPWFSTQDAKIQATRSSRESGAVMAQARTAVESASPYYRAQITQSYSRSLTDLTKIVVKRQFLLAVREYQTVILRLLSAVLISVISGSLFLQLAPTAYYAKFGLLLSALLNLAMGNFAELPATFEGRNAVTKHLDASMYPASSFIMSVVIMWLPVMVAESILFACPLYFMSGLVSDAGRFFFFTLLLLVSNLMFAALFRAASYTVASIERAEQIVNPLFDCVILFGGFMVTANKIPDFLVEFYWLSPVSWALRSMAQNEFLSPAYGEMGERALVLFEMQTDSVWKWTGIAYLLGFTVFCLVLCSYFLALFRFDVSQGTKRKKEDNAAIQQSSASLAQIPHQPSSGVQHVSLSLPFTPSSLVFKDLHYTVQVKTHDGQVVDRKLLNGISGYIAQGQCTALMGSSGAGKTTLLDVVAGRKTVGQIEGSIMVNGQPQDPSVYSVLSGYCEQQDLHLGLSTVRESFLFSAFLRLPKSIDEKTREAFVDEVIELLELTSVKDRIIGNEHYVGLSPGQLKLVTIGVELCANPSILFLDEPTSSLDSRAALVVMRVVKNIAATGRTALCTIHQPSSEVFYLFDQLMLLKSGGEVAYFGPVGEEGQAIVEYFENDGRTGDEARITERRPDAPRIPEGMNPATWILDVIGAGVEGALLRAQMSAGYADASSAIEYASLYRSSHLGEIETNEMNMLLYQPTHQITVDLADFKKPTYKLCWALFKRSSLSAWRDSHTNFGRLCSMSFLGLAFGLIFLQLDDTDYAGVNSKLNAVFYVMTLGGWAQTLLAVPTIIYQRPVIAREKASNSYPSWCYSLSLSLVDVPYVAAATLILVLWSYFLIGFAYNVEDFFRFYIAVLLGVLCLCSFGAWTGAAFRGYVASTSVSSTVLLMFFLFGGGFLHPSDIPSGWKWFFYLSPIPRSLFACAVDQFRCDASDPYTNTDECPSIDLLADDGTTSRVTTHAYINSILEVGYDTYANHLAYLMAMWVFWQVATAVSLRHINHVKR